MYVALQSVHVLQIMRCYLPEYHNAPDIGLQFLDVSNKL